MTKEQIHNLKVQRAIGWMHDQAASGLGKDEWCEKNGIKRWQFYKWQRVIKNMMLDSIDGNGHPLIAADVPEPDPVFIEIPAPTEAAVSTAPSSANKNYNFDNLNNSSNPDAFSGSGMTVSCGSFTINVSTGVDEVLLSKVLKAVSNAN